MRRGRFRWGEEGLCITIILGLCFVFIQVREYWHARFTIMDGVYGSAFYMLTGLHGLHVIFGLVFLFTALMRLYLKHFSPTRHLHLDFAVAYWHFVDIIWVLLFALVYVWPHHCISI